MGKARYTTYLKEELIEKLKQLSEETRIPQAKFIEEAVKDLLLKYKVKLG